MAFESLSEKYEFRITNFPQEWIPLVHLYDPDLPLFPLLYFHFLDPALPKGHRPGERDRVFGFVHHVGLVGPDLAVSVALNKDLAQEKNSQFREPLELIVMQRLGLKDRVTLEDISGALKGRLAPANKVLLELWYQVVDRSFGKGLPFGRIWDEVFGLVRFIASWNSEGGRKGELIQAHFFASAFGARIQTGGGIHVDYYLLPTFAELTDETNPLSLFPRFSDLLNGADDFVKKYCIRTKYSGFEFSAFQMLKTGVGSKLKTETVLAIINKASGHQRDALFENYNAFNRGPQRSIIALMMFHDLRHRLWEPEKLTPEICATMYDRLQGSYQTPKVIQLYVQQCFGSPYVLPIDNWVETFLQWPLGFKETTSSSYYSDLFACSDRWGKLERLIWLAAQARKVHSSVCAEILWCIRFGGPEKEMRGANPLSCKICEEHIRTVCPAFAAVRKAPVAFNSKVMPPGGFTITTSDGNNSKPGQSISKCRGWSTNDEYSANDRAEKFSQFPISGHDGSNISVEEFIEKY